MKTALFLLSRPPVGLVETPFSTIKDLLGTTLTSGNLFIHSCQLGMALEDPLAVFNHVDRLQQHFLGDRCVTFYGAQQVKGRIIYVVPHGYEFRFF